MIEQMVVGIDGSNPSFEAFEQALDLARRTHSAIKCVFVVDSRKTQVPIVYTGSSFDISLERIYLPLDPNLKQYYVKIADDLHAFAKNCTGYLHATLREERGNRFLLDSRRLSRPRNCARSAGRGTSSS